MSSTIQGGGKPSAPRLSEPARSIAAMLSSEPAALDEEALEEAAAGQRLAARFARRPGQKPSGPARASMTPYLAAGALVLLAGGAAAYYFMSSGFGAGQEAGSGYVAASFTSPFSVGSGAQPAPAWTPQDQNGAAARGPASPGWAEAVETFRALASPEAPPAPAKVDEPQLEKLATGYNASGAQ